VTEVLSSGGGTASEADDMALFLGSMTSLPAHGAACLFRTHKLKGWRLDGSWRRLSLQPYGRRGERFG
jgi:hypothetical protein